MLFFVAIALCLAVVAAGMVLAVRAPNASGRLVTLAGLGMFFGALIGAAPGGILFVGAAVVASTGPGGRTSWTGLTLLFLGGLLVGGALGAAALARLSEERPRGLVRAMIYALIGGVVSCGAACGALFLADTGGANPASDFIVYLAPIMMLSASLGAFARGVRPS